MTDLLQFLADKLGSDAATVAIAVAVVVNLVLAVLAAWRMGTFDTRKLADTFGKHLFPQIAAYWTVRIGAALAAEKLAELLGSNVPLPISEPVANTILVAILTSMVAKMWGHLGDLGFPVEVINKPLRAVAARLGFGATPGGVLSDLGQWAEPVDVARRISPFDPPDPNRPEEPPPFG